MKRVIILFSLLLGLANGLRAQSFEEIFSDSTLRLDYVFSGNEYFYDDQYETVYPADTEPWEPNLTTLVDFHSKWADMLPQGLPVPTLPSGQNVYEEVGVYEGGGYQSHGVYRPAQECRMKINEAPVFCPVCKRAISRVIDYHR